MYKNIFSTVGICAVCALLLLGFLTINKKKIEITKNQTTTNEITEEKDAYEKDIKLSDFSYRTNKACEDFGDQGEIEILHKGKAISRLTKQNCPVQTVHFIANVDNKVLFSIEPSGLGGYYIYTPDFNIHIFDFKTREITQVWKGIQGTSAVDTIRKNVALVTYDGNPTLSDNDPKFKLTILNLASDKQNSFDFTLERTAQIGHLSFSPSGAKIAIEVGYGPDDERGEIYIFDTITGKQTQVVTENKHLEIDVWKNENEIIWSEWKI